MADTENTQDDEGSAGGAKWTIVAQGMQKAAEAMASVSNAFEVEDEFRDFYAASETRPQIIVPPYDMKVLERVSQENNTLPACIEAMVCNIEGTGYTFNGPEELETSDTKDPKVAELEAIFGTFGIDESFTTVVKQRRRDLETVGNAFLEFIRNMTNQIMVVRRIEAKMMRLVKLDAAVAVTKKVLRNGAEVEVSIYVRERRFCQMVAGRTLVFFREFGSSRHLNRTTGEWETPEKPVAPQDRATEVMHFALIPDANTPYGIPRWVSQLPSVLGSRRAEEFNLEFFNAGGVPPAIIFLQGGTLSSSTKKSLNDLNVGSAIKKQRIAVIELESTDGSLDKGSNTARVTVERFGADRQSDSMFDKFDDKASARVRRAFRLPPIFLGEASDYNFATSHTSYMVAEQQVFRPERDESDEIISMQLLPAMGYPGYRMVSNPLTLKNADVLLKGVELAKTIGGVSGEDMVDALNDATGSDFEFDEDYAPLTPKEQQAADAEKEQASMSALSGGPSGPPKAKAVSVNSDVQKSPSTAKLTVVKEDSVRKLTKIDGLYALAFELRDAILGEDTGAIKKGFAEFQQLTPHDQTHVREALAKMVYISDDTEDMGLSELAGCSQVVLARETLTKGDPSHCPVHGKKALGSGPCNCGVDHS